MLCRILSTLIETFANAGRFDLGRAASVSGLVVAVPNATERQSLCATITPTHCPAITFPSAETLSEYNFEQFRHKLESKVLALCEWAPFYVFYSLRYGFMSHQQPVMVVVPADEISHSFYAPKAQELFLTIVSESLSKQCYYITVDVSLSSGDDDLDDASNTYKIILPWSDCLLPAFNVTFTEQQLKPIEWARDSVRAPCLRNSLDMERIHKLASYYSRLRFPGKIFRKPFPEECFVANTLVHAPMINGIACGGKSSILQRIVTQLRSKYESSVPQILKTSLISGFQGKDSDQVCAMQYQYVSLALARDYYACVFDRCPFNNMLWRFIMRYLDSTEDMVALFCEDMQRMSDFMIKAMSKEPIIVIIDDDAEANRRRMFIRRHGQDVLRCSIENYTKAQNMVYASFAHLCHWPIFLVSELMDPDDNASARLEALVLDKVAANIRAHEGKMHPPLLLSTRHRSDRYLVDEHEYRMAKANGVFK